MKILAITPNGKHDYLVSSIIEGLKKTDLNVVYTGWGNGEPSRSSIDRCIEFAKECNIILAFWGKCKWNGVPEPRYDIVDLVNGWNKTAYIDGSEYNYTGFPKVTNETLHPEFLKLAKWYFKRECLPDHVKHGVIPLPFAAVDSDFYNLSPVEKDIDVLCAFGQTNTGQRKSAIEACEELKREGYNIINHKVSNYSECMNRAWITVDAYGGGECNARTFQVMANHSLLFMERYNIVIPNLVDGEHYVSWDNKEDFKKKVKKYLDNKEDINKLTVNSYENVLENHTSKARVEYIFDQI